MPRFRLAAITVTLVGLALAATPVALVGAQADSTPSAAQGPIQFGAAQGPTPGLTRVQAIQALEGVAGRQLAVIRVYDLWNSTFRLDDHVAQVLRPHDVPVDQDQAHQRNLREVGGHRGRQAR